MTKVRLLVAGLLAGALTLGVATFAPAQEPAVTVKMLDTPAVYRPDPVKIKVGQTVKWVNTGETVHTVTTDPAQAPDPSWASVPKGAETFDSGYMNVGDEFSYAFKVPGTYKYFCLTHIKEGMKGEVDVEK